MDPVALSTARLVLRPWRPADREPFAALNADREVMRYFPEALTRSQSDALADRIEALILERGWGLWALERRDDGRFAGFTGLGIPKALLPFQPCVEVGWRLAREFWGMGYATEAAQAALRFGFEGLCLPEVVSFTAMGNLRSQAVMQRLHMVRDPATFGHPSLPPGHDLREHCLYRLSQELWRSRASQAAKSGYECKETSA